VLVMDDKPAALETIKSCIDGLPRVEVLAATDLKGANEAIKGTACDCVVLGESVAHTMLSPLAREMRASGAEACTQFIVFNPATGHIDTAKNAIAQHPNATQVRSLDRLLDQATLALHQGVEDLPERYREVLRDIHDSNQVLAGKKVLIVDDDVRNIFALTSVLEECDMTILSAENGRAAISILRNQPDVDIVLMDIMMPDMDGFDTIKEVRKMDLRGGLPIVAVTAKAMKGDRERCMAAGAWDYLSKPVDRLRLMRVLRAWLQ
jgi:CheY-like chemotaxis protein